jgi:hypothetical protein
MIPYILKNIDKLFFNCDTVPCPRTWDSLDGLKMKSQDIGILLKLICLHKREKGLLSSFGHNGWEDWEWGLENELIGDWHPTKSAEDFVITEYSVRSLADSTGISKSQVNLALQRCFNVGLAKRDRNLDVPRTNTKALTEFIVYGLRYVFPAKLGSVTRGIATSLGAPILKDKLMSTGEFIPVWTDARGNTKGQAVEPLFKSVTHAVRRDPELYALLALVDAIRIGQPRERNVAINMLQEHLGG